MWRRQHPSNHGSGGKPSPVTTAADDPNAFIRYEAAVLDVPVVVGREIMVNFAAPRGFFTRANGHRIHFDGEFCGTLSGLLSRVSIDDTQFDWVAARLDEFATTRAAVLYVAAPRKLSCFYGPDGTAVPFPAISVLPS